MLVCLNFGKRTPEVPVFVVAGRIMVMYHKVGVPTNQITVSVVAFRGVLVDSQRLRATYRNLALHRCHLSIAVISMGRDVTLLLQRNGRQNQCVDRTEHHHTCKTRHNLIPAFLSLMCIHIFFCALQGVVLHISITILLSVTILPISIFRSQAGARPGRQFFQQSVLQRRSQLWCCANPAK